MFAVLLLTAASFALVVPGLGPGTAQAQSTSFEVTSFEVSQIALGPRGGSVTVEIEAASSLAPLALDIQLRSPQGTIHRLPAIEANALSSSTVSAQAPVTIPGGTSGWWTILVAGAQTTGEDPQTLSATGTTAQRVLVHPDVPLAGEEGGPMWSQPGGDPMHSGHTLAIGPEERPIERWSFRSQNSQPFHAPVVTEDGRILALTWSGDTYALDGEGELLWVHRPNSGGISAFPPALNARGHLVFGQEGQGTKALDGSGQVAWHREVASPVSGPVTTEDGRTYLLEEPWTLVALDGQGRQLSSTALPQPEGLANPVPQIPVPTQGPRLAVSADGQAVALSGDGIAVVNATGGVTDTLACNCTPRSVGLVPDLPIALVGGETQLVSISLTSGEIIWTTGRAGLDALTDIQGTIWAPPALNWDRLLHLATEEGRLHTVTLDGDHRWNQGGFEPIRGQGVVDANGHLFVSDCRRGLYARASDGTPMWSEEINWDTCGGLTTGLTLTRSGGLLWASPDGDLRMFGSNRLPVPAFNASWTGEAWSFDAQASHDPDGTPLTYAWTFGDGSTARGVQATHEYTTSGTYDVTLAVSDGTSTATARQELVVNFPPRPSIVDASEGNHIELNASTSTDPEGDRIFYNWTLGDEHAGNGSTLAFTAPSARVHPITLTVSDGNLARTTSYTALAPDPSAWSSVTLALYDGSCPAGICSFPETLDLVEDRFLKLLVVNGGSTSVTASIPFEAVPGGENEITIPAGNQATLHVNTGEPGSSSLELAPLNAPSSITRVPVDVRRAPAQITWHLEAPSETPRVNQLSRAGVVLEGTAPPGPADLRISLRLDGQEITSRRVGLRSGEPVNTTVHLGFTPEATGPLSVSATVESLNTDRAVVTDPPDEEASTSLTVEQQTLLSRIAQALPVGATGWLSLLLLVLIAAGAAGGAIYLNRRRPDPDVTPPSTGAPATAAAATGDDATVAGSFMPRKVERFHIERVLGEGGFGTTYLARDTVLEREVVLKQIEHVGQGEARELLLHEARAAANLSHPNVVVVHDVIEENGKLLLVMEYVEGGTLQDLLTDGGADPKKTLSVFTDLLQGLSALHEAGVVHRDLKPSNILLTRGAEAKITDFGVAARMGEPGSLGEDTFVGTPRYMAPEQLAGDRPGPAADVYAAGAILYEMLTGDHHLGLENGQVPEAEEILKRTSKLPAPGLEPALNAVLERALARTPEDRFESAEAFLQALRTTYREGS